MDINTFAALVVLASALVTFVGAAGIIRDASRRPERELDAELAAVFPIVR